MSEPMWNRSAAAILSSLPQGADAGNADGNGFAALDDGHGHPRDVVSNDGREQRGDVLGRRAAPDKRNTLHAGQRVQHD